MTPEQIHQLLDEGTFPETAGPETGGPEATGKRELVETHISWVIFCEQFVYKIKKPLQYSFLDFSTPEQRKVYCEKEVALNQRLAPDIYLEVVPIRLEQDNLIVGGTGNDIIDYAVKMRKLDRDKQVDVLLRNNKVTLQDMARLAETIADFRQIDVLNEVAFLCMDLDAHDRHDLGEQFLRCYNDSFPAMRTAEEEQLFIYYKSYRANVRAKAASLRARSAEDDAEKKKALTAAEKYLALMDGYIEVLERCCCVAVITGCCMRRDMGLKRIRLIIRFL